MKVYKGRLGNRAPKGAKTTMHQFSPLGLEPKTLARMAELGSRERMESAARGKIKTRLMNDRPRGVRTLEESIDEWRPDILQGDGTVQP